MDDDWHGHWRAGDAGAWTVMEVLRSRAVALADRPFLRWGDGPWRTHGEVDLDARRIGNGLTARGLDPGERVAVVLPDIPELVALWLGIRKAGGVAAFVDPATPGEALADMLAAIGPRIIVTSHELRPAVDAARDRTPGPGHLIVHGHAAGPGAESFANLLDHSDAEPFGVAHRPQDDACVATGDGPPAVLPEAADHLAALTVLAHLARTRDGWAAGEQTFLACAPAWDRTARTWCVRAALLAGGRAALAPRAPGSPWRDAAEAGATVLVLSEGLAERIAAAPPTGRERAHRVHTAISGPVPAGVAATFAERFGVHLFTGLLVPGAGMVACDHPGLPPVAGSAGTAAPGHVLSVVDPATDLPLPRGTPGELAVKPLLPAIVMRALAGDPEATVRAFRNLVLHTGREAVMDQDGFVHLRS